MLEKLALIGSEINVALADLLAKFVIAVVTEMFAPTNETHECAHIILGEDFTEMQ